MSSLFGSGKTDSNSETPIPQLSVEEEIEVLAAHIGGIASGMTIEIELRELLGILDGKSRISFAPRHLTKTPLLPMPKTCARRAGGR